jgi:NADPH:quinone reductase-like Zn-dependent oxidoreductase
MRAFALESFETPAKVQELPIPPVGAGEVRVRVLAASINGFDAALASGMLKDLMEHRFPVTIGKDFAGVVEEVGEDVSNVAPGDEVFGIVPLQPPLHRGSFAGQVVVAAEPFLAKKPSRLSFTEAAGFGLAALAAQVCLDAAHPSRGDRVLIAGATGGVGAFAVQLAAARGARVIATGLGDDEAWLRELGAAETIDYGGDLPATVRERHPDGIEVLIDLVHRGDDFEGVSSLVQDGGRIVTTLGTADVEKLAARGIEATNVNAESSPAAFDRVVSAATKGELTVAVTQTFSLEDVSEGLQVLGSGKARGKLAVSMEG